MSQRDWRKSFHFSAFEKCMSKRDRRKERKKERQREEREIVERERRE